MNFYDQLPGTLLVVVLLLNENRSRLFKVLRVVLDGLSQLLGVTSKLNNEISLEVVDLVTENDKRVQRVAGLVVNEIFKCVSAHGLAW